MSDEATIKALAAAEAALLTTTRAVKAVGTAFASTAEQIAKAKGASLPPADMVLFTSAASKAADELAKASQEQLDAAKVLAVAVVTLADAAKTAAAAQTLTLLPAGVTVTALGVLQVDLRFRGPLPYGKKVQAQLHVVDPEGDKLVINADFPIDGAANSQANGITTFRRPVLIAGKLKPSKVYNVGATLFTIQSNPTAYPEWPGLRYDGEVVKDGAHWLVGEFKTSAAAAPTPPAPAPGPSPGVDILVYPFPGTFWQKKLPDGVKEFGPGDARTNAIRDLKVGQGFAVNSKEWTQGPTRAKASDPIRKLHISAQWIRPQDPPASWRSQIWDDLPIPDALVADSGYSDAHAIVAYPPGVLDEFPEGAFLDLWQARKQPDSSWRASAGVLYSATSDGLNFSQMNGGQREEPPKLRNAGWGACRAAGCTARGGLIVADELVKGINHLLMLSLPPAITCDGWARAPATKDEKQGENKVQIPMGAFFRLPKGFNVDSLGLRSAEGRQLAIAARDFGFLVLDCSLTRAINTDRADATTVRLAGNLANSGDWGRIGGQLVYCEHPDFTRIYR